jgi:hypothetical protein
MAPMAKPSAVRVPSRNQITAHNTAPTMAIVVYWRFK